MTDHKYPNEIASCHTMLKKRDEIITNLNERLQAENQPRVDNNKLISDMNLLRVERDDLLKLHNEAVEDNATLIEENKSEEKRQKQIIDQLQGQLDQEVNNANKIIGLSEEVTKKANHEFEMEKIYDNKIALLEEKLALCDTEYNELKDGLKELLENGPRKKKE